MRRMERLETRIKLLEDEQRGGIDITKFYGSPGCMPKTLRHPWTEAGGRNRRPEVGLAVASRQITGTASLDSAGLVMVGAPLATGLGCRRPNAVRTNSLEICTQRMAVIAGYCLASGGLPIVLRSLRSMTRGRSRTRAATLIAFGVRVSTGEPL